MIVLRQSLTFDNFLFPCDIKNEVSQLYMIVFLILLHAPELRYHKIPRITHKS